MIMSKYDDMNKDVEDKGGPAFNPGLAQKNTAVDDTMGYSSNSSRHGDIDDIRASENTDDDEEMDDEDEDLDEELDEDEDSDEDEEEEDEELDEDDAYEDIEDEEDEDE